MVCILAKRKQGKQERWLNRIDKCVLLLDAYHIDHLGPLQSTKKSYAHLFVVIDAFSEFVWLYPTKSTGAAEVIQRLSKQQAIYGNPKRIISDRGTAFTSNDFEKSCEKKKIQHILNITKGTQTSRAR